MKKEKKKKSLLQNIIEWILTILVALVIAFGIRSFIFEPVRVDGESMLDTLQDGEIMFVSKYDYSTTWIISPFGSAESKKEAAQNCAKWTFGGNPQRFDVVICRYPNRGDTNFVKRVIGLPGDTLKIENGYVYIKEAGSDEFVKQEEPYIKDEYRSGYGSNMKEYTVPEGQYFVMGDHRNNSNDSRNVGPIDRNMIIGHVRQVLFPFNQWRAVQ